MWFGARDQETRGRYVSKLAGTTEVLSCSTRRSTLTTAPAVEHVNDSTSQTTRPLLHPDEVGSLANDEMLLFIEGVPGVVRAKRKPYFRCFEYLGKYRENPYFHSRTGSGFLSWLWGALWE